MEVTTFEDAIAQVGPWALSESAGDNCHDICYENCVACTDNCTIRIFSSRTYFCLDSLYVKAVEPIGGCSEGLSPIRTVEECEKAARFIGANDAVAELWTEYGPDIPSGCWLYEQNLYFNDDSDRWDFAGDNDLVHVICKDESLTLTRTNEKSGKTLIFGIHLEVVSLFVQKRGKSLTMLLFKESPVK